MKQKQEQICHSTSLYTETFGLIPIPCQQDLINF